jgi:hypothetical protein
MGEGLEGAIGSHRGKRVLQGYVESYRGPQEIDSRTDGTGLKKKNHEN